MSDLIDFKNYEFVFLDNDVMNYDVAQDLIGDVIAIYSKKIYDARLGKDDDDDIVKSLLAEQGKLVRVKRHLKLGDQDAVKKAIEHYGKILRDYDKENADD